MSARCRIVAVALAVACSAAACGGGGPSSPPIEDAVWDGSRFVVHNNAHDEDGRIWTSPDGLTWERSDEFTMAALPFGCHPDHPCDLAPESIETVPLHFATPWSRALAGHGDVVIHEVGVSYDLRGNDDTLPTELHPQFLALAEQTSECFAQLRRQPPDGEPDPDRAYVEQWGSSPEGVSATCTKADRSDRFSVDFADVLTEDQRRLVEGGSSRQLFVTTAGGEVTRVPDPPMSAWLDGADDQRSAISEVVASSDRFWSVDDGVVVSSVDGLSWDPVAVGPDGWSADRVAASPGGDVAVAFRNPKISADDPSTHVVASNDDGETWGPLLETPSPFWWLVDVGPSAVAIMTADTDRLVVLDTSSGSTTLTIDDRIPGLLADTGIGAETIVVPQVVYGSGIVDTAHFEIYDLQGQLIGSSG